MKKPSKKFFSLLLAISLVLGLGSVVFAQNYNEAPMLKELVQKGELPSVEERLPIADDVYVVDPVESIGKYGGTLHTAGTSIDGDGDDQMAVSQPQLVMPKAEGNGTYPHIVKNIESSEDATVWTFYMRKGMKWSDGYPFTADDMMFWYNDVLLNQELTPYISSIFKADDQVMEMTKIDDYTFQWKFVSPKPFLLERLVHPYICFYPAHYLKQYHIKYADKEDLDKKVKDAGFDYWYELFGHVQSTIYGLAVNDPNLPVLSAYKLVKKTSNRRIYERNPYFWKVDTAGNQLPYIDRIENTIVSDREVYNGKVISGELDFAGIQSDIRNYPMFKKYEEQGGYRTILWESGMGSEVVYMFNLNHKDPVLREIFQDVRFRRALSLGINRQEISNAIYFGKATPLQMTVLKGSKYYEEEFANAYVEYDPTRANKLLDEMGLTKRDSEGYRLRPDGKRLSFTIEYFPTETPKAPNVELVSQYWEDLGVKVASKQISGELASQRAPAGLTDVYVWHGDLATDIIFPVAPYYFVPYAPAWSKATWPQWARYYRSGGEAGEEPPTEVKQLRTWWEEIMVTPNEEHRKELAHNILAAQAENLWVVGTVGRAPFPIIANKHLRNIPESGIWCWDSLWTMSRDPEQWFFDNL